MKIVDGRGMHTKKTAEKNMARVEKWFKDNPNSTITDCYKALGLSIHTVRKHVKALMDK